MKRCTDGVMDSTDAVMKYVVPCWKIKRSKHMKISKVLMVLEWIPPKKKITKCSKIVQLPAVTGCQKYW